MLMSISFSDFFKDFLIILGAVFHREGGEVINLLRKFLSAGRRVASEKASFFVRSAPTAVQPMAFYFY